MFGRDNSVTTTFNAKDNMSPVVRGIRRTMDDFKRDAKQGFGLAAGISVFDTATRAIKGVADFLGDATRAAMEDERSQRQLGQALSNNISNWDGNTQAIEDAIAARQNLGFRDDELRNSLGRLVTRTKDINKALALQSQAMDLARARGIDLASASDLVGKAYDGQVGALRRAGLAIDQNANSTQALAQLQAAVGGQAEAWADTTEGAMTSAQIALEEVQEAIGYALLPAVKELAIYTRDELVPIIYDLMESVGGLGEGFNQLNRVMNPSTADAQDYESALRGLAKEMGVAYEEVKKVSDTMSVPMFAEGTEQSVIFAAMLDEVRSRLQYLNAMKLDGSAIASMLGGDSAGVKAAAQATGREYVEALFGSLYYRNVPGDAGRGFRINELLGLDQTAEKAGRQFVAGLFGSIDKNSDGARINQAWWNRMLDVPGGPKQAISSSFVAMFKTMKDYRSEWKAEWQNVVDYIKDPFRPAKLEKWVAKRVENLMKEARDKANPEPVRRRYRQVARAMTGPIFAALVELGVGIDEAVADILMVQQLGSTLNGVGSTLFDAVVGVFGGGGGGGSKNKKNKRNRKRNAMGGFIPEGGTSLVGENGPELITLTGGGGRVTPNHHLGRPIVVNVDGRRLFEIMDARNGRAIAMGG